MLLSGMYAALNDFDKGTESSVFEEYAQQIDRIMGAAYTLSLATVGDLCKLGKEVGYKASQVHDINKLHALQSLLRQLIRVLRELLKHIAKGETPDLSEANMLVLKLQKASSDLGDLRVTLEN